MASSAFPEPVSGIKESLLDAAGDIVYASADNTPARLGIGSTNQALGVSGGVPAYQASSKSTLTTTGDIMYASAANTPARLGIGTTGQVVTVASGIPSWATPAASTPSFVGCSLYNSSSLNVANNTETTINYDSEYIDTHGFHDSVNPSRITIPAGYAGKYLISAANRWIQSANGARNMNMYVNNVSVVDMMNLPGNSTTLSYCFRSLIYTLAVGDFIQIRASQTNGSALDMYLRTIEMPFSVQWLGV